MPSNAWWRGSYLPGPQALNSALVAASSAGERATIAPTFRSMLAQPSSRLPIPGANELSTEEWQRAQVMPTLVSCPRSLTFPCTPTTAFSRNNSTVTAGLVRSTCPACSAAMICRRQRLDVDLEAHRQRGRRGDRRNHFVHPQHIGPQLLVAEGVVAEDGLPSPMVPRRPRQRDRPFGLR